MKIGDVVYYAYLTVTHEKYLEFLFDKEYSGIIKKIESYDNPYYKHHYDNVPLATITEITLVDERGFIIKNPRGGHHFFHDHEIRTLVEVEREEKITRDLKKMEEEIEQKKFQDELKQKQIEAIPEINNSLKEISGSLKQIIEILTTKGVLS